MKEEAKGFSYHVSFLFDEFDRGDAFFPVFVEVRKDGEPLTSESFENIEKATDWIKETDRELNKERYEEEMEEER